jgi:colicin import membrane protein
MMTNNRESSVLFSLNELMALEQQRVTEEAAARAALRAAELEQKEAAARALREQEAARLRQAEETRRAEEFRRREEQARLEALRHAETARVLLEAEHRARMAELSVAQEHERQLARLEKEQGARRLKWGIVATASVLVLVTLGSLAAFRSVTAQSDADKLALARQNESTLADSERRTGQLQREIERINAEREELKKRPIVAAPASVPTVPTAQRSPQKPPPARTTPPAPKEPKCLKGDPMCGTLEG